MSTTGPLPTLRVESINGRSVFPSILCEECVTLPTQHRCLTEVINGYLFENRVVCGFAICALCSSRHGNEGVFKCKDHSVALYAIDKAQQKSLQPINEQRKSLQSTWIHRSNSNVDADTSKARAKSKASMANVDPVPQEKKKASREQGMEYSSTEILLLSKAWISASENTLTGVSQKITTFWDSVLKAYNVFKEQHEQYLQRQKDKERFRLKNLRNSLASNDFDSSEESDNNMEDSVTLPVRNVGSLQQKWSKKIQPLVYKFIGVTTRYPKRSGEDREAYYNRVHLIFLKENEAEKSFDLYRPSWEYLQDKPKFTVTLGLPSRKREVIQLEEEDDDDDNKENVVEVQEKLHPMGRNSMKRKLEEEKILNSVSKMISNTKTTSTSAHLSSALEKIALSVGAAINSWQMQSALTNCSDAVQRQYNDLIIKRQIQLMMEEDDANKAKHCNPNITPTQLNNTFSTETPGTCAESESEDEVVIPESLPEESFKN